MPFAKMAGGVTGSFQGLSNGDLVFTHRVTPLETAHAVGVPAGEDTGAGGRTNGCGCIETIKAQTVFGHLIKDGGLENLVVHVTHVTPTLIIGHGENDIGTFRFSLGSEDCGCE